MGVIVERRAHLEISNTLHARKDAPSFGRLCDAQAHDLMGGHPRDVLTLEQDAAFARARGAADGHHERGFACAVCADNGDDLALVHLKVHTPEAMILP